MAGLQSVPLVVPHDRLDGGFSGGWVLALRGGKEGVCDQKSYFEGGETSMAGWGSRGMEVAQLERCYAHVVLCDILNGPPRGC
jgi:hypothetical protein